MAEEEKLPWELIEEILSRVPPPSLVRFRTVCKRWNALFDDKMFIHNHKETFRFILATKSKIYSVSVDTKIEVHELTLGIPCLESETPKYLIDCNEFLLCVMVGGAAVWNPWLNQTKWIEPEVNHPTFDFEGVIYKYDNKSLERSDYKTLASYWKVLDPPNNYEITCWTLYDFASGKWKDLGAYSDIEEDKPTLHTLSGGVSLNGNLYWVAFHDMADPLCHIRNFDFSTENFSEFCYLPCGINHKYDALALKVFRGDRFSLLKKSHKTKKIEIWVTKNKINYDDGDDVVWMNFMALSIPNLPSLGPYLPGCKCQCQPSYFINGKRLVVCSCDDYGQAWIYVAEDNKLISQIKLDSVVDPWPWHCTYIPSLIPVLGSKINEASFQQEKEAE